MHSVSILSTKVDVTKRLINFLQERSYKIISSNHSKGEVTASKLTFYLKRNYFRFVIKEENNGTTNINFQINPHRAVVSKTRNIKEVQLQEKLYCIL